MGLDLRTDDIEVTPELLAMRETIDKLRPLVSADTLKLMERDLEDMRKPAPLTAGERCRDAFKRASADGNMPTADRWIVAAAAAREGMYDEADGELDRLAGERDEAMAKIKASIPIAEMTALLERMRESEVPNDRADRLTLNTIIDRLAHYAKHGGFDERP